VPKERDQYIRLKMECPSCRALMYCRLLARRESGTVMLPCSACGSEIVLAIIPDEKMDGCHSEKGLWAIPLFDLTYLGDRFVEEEGDRLVWGCENVLEARINRYRKEQDEKSRTDFVGLGN
jgi:hypothetical protein